MSTTLQIKGILLLLAATSVVLLISIVFYSQEQIRQASSIVSEERKMILDQISSRLELKFNDAITILQITSKNDHITSPPSKSSMDDKLHGIPTNVDADRRKVMHDVFETYGIFQNMLFLLPNGDVYINEPFVFQQNMTTSNFAFRDWYKDVITYHSPVVSQVVVSKSSGRPNVVVAIPVFSQNGTLQGILTGSLSLDKTQQRLEALKSYSDERILIADNAGTVVADSDGSLKGQRASIGTDAIQKALSGESGTTTDTVNGTDMFVAYHPIKIGQTTWAVISVQPHDEVFHSINTTIVESYAFAILIALITTVSSYFLYNAFKARIKLSQEIEKSNIALQIQSQKLREADRAKEEFSTMVSHELKTPLVTISGYAEMLSEDGILGSLNDEQIKAVEKITLESAKLGRLISDIMDSQKLDLERMKFNKKEFKVDEFMDEQVQIHSKLMTDKKIRFINSTEGKFSMTSDPDRLSQVFANLIKNSVDFVPENGGMIEINAHRENNQVVFYVKDNGSGIPREKQENLFKKFYQIDTSLKRSHGGTGLGLVICKGITEALGGTIWFESEVGKGTTVWFNIPLNGTKA